ncbi:TonB family protein [Haliangium sp.]|uniref:TonB family protein n=1 Tax=Haliangium sp. TaxID=2663208 RepID=UPI003D0F59C7
MFERYVGSKSASRGRHRSLLMGASITVHAAVAVGMLVHGFWQIERLAMPSHELRVAVQPALAPPPPPSAPSVKRQVPPSSVRVRPRDTTQPVTAEVDDQDVIVSDDVGSSIGVPSGQPGGVPHIGIETGPSLLPVVEITPPPALPARTEPRVVKPTVVEGQRVAGNARIAPDQEVKLQMARDGRERIQAVVKMCLDRSGEVSSTQIVRSSGFADYDAKLRREMRSWVYRPYLAGGEPVPVCTTVTFIYAQR